jgi:membrane protein DedA with SNARE-associated domain
VNPKWDKLKGALKRREYLVGILGITLTVVLLVAVVCYWREIKQMAHYGYLGAFIISVLGGATILAPIPNTPVVFALGAIMKPSFAPYLGPVFVGAAAGLGETVGNLSIYMTGYGGGTALHSIGHQRIRAAYLRMLGWVEKRGSLTLFVLSAVINPFFYPAALAAGALRFGIRRFFFICWGGKTIKAISVASIGYWGLGGLLRALGVPI